MSQTVKLTLGSLPMLREVDERLMSYNVEMAEITGGTFWKEYTPGSDCRHRAFPADRKPDAGYAQAHAGVSAD